MKLVCPVLPEVDKPARQDKGQGHYAESQAENGEERRPVDVQSWYHRVTHSSGELGVEVKEDVAGPCLAA